MSNSIWSFIIVAALAGWIFSVILFIFSAFPGSGKFDSSAGRFWGVSIVVFFGIWIAGLVNA